MNLCLENSFSESHKYSLVSRKALREPIALRALLVISFLRTKNQKEDENRSREKSHIAPGLLKLQQNNFALEQLTTVLHSPLEAIKY